MTTTDTTPGEEEEDGATTIHIETQTQLKSVSRLGDFARSHANGTGNYAEKFIGQAEMIFLYLPTIISSC